LGTVTYKNVRVIHSVSVTGGLSINLCHMLKCHYVTLTFEAEVLFTFQFLPHGTCSVDYKDYPVNAAHGNNFIARLTQNTSTLGGQTELL
jgi:hypothetical protein